MAYDSTVATPEAPPTQSSIVQMFDPKGNVREIPSAQADAAKKAGGRLAVKMTDPKGTQRWIPENMVDQALKAGGKKVDAGPDLTSNPVNPKTGKGEGLYEMTNEAGDTIKVPYSKVMDASKAGYRTTQKERDRFASDQTAYLKEHHKGRFFSEGEFRNQPLPEAIPDEPGAWGKLRAGVESATEPTSVFKGAPTLQPLDPVTGEMGLNFIKRVGRTLFGIADFGPSSYSALKDALSDDPKKALDGQERLIHLHPDVQIQDMVQELHRDYKKDPKIAITDAAGTGVGMWLGGKVMEGAPKAIKATLGKSVDAANKVAKDTFGIRPKVAADVVEKTVKANKDAAKDYWDETHKSVKETGEREDVAAAETRGNQMSADDKHEADLKDVREKNNRKRAQHREEVSQIEKDAEAAKDALKKRQQLEEKIKTKTAETFEADEQERIAAKDEENAAWKPWRDVAEKFRKPADTIVAAIKKYGVNTTELHRLLHDMKVNPEDEPETSRYYLDRQWATDQMKLPNHPKYSELSLAEKSRVNDWMDRIGVRPPTVSIDLDEGASVSLDEVHRAKSVLRRHANEMRRSGKLVEAGELDQVANVLTDTETDWSREAGVYDELMHAKTATANYQETFGREIPEPKTKIGEAEKTTNPEFLKEQDEEEQLSQIAKRNPDLSKSHEKIRAMREELKGMESEEKLNGIINAERPEPPAIGDLRGGKYELEPEPKHPGKVPPVEPTPKARPEIPEAVQAGEEDVSEANRKQYQSTIDRLRHKGIYIASTGIGLITSGLLHALVKLNFPAIVTDVIGGATATALSVAGLNRIADMLESPGAREWFAKPTEAQMKELGKLPDWQRKAAAEGFRKIKVVADKKGYKVSPLIVAYMAANKGEPRVPDQDEGQK
jgi:hypothetical protein